MRNPIKILKQLLGDIKEIKENVVNTSAPVEEIHRGPVQNPAIVTESA